jgi:hypothetical protein
VKSKLQSIIIVSMKKQISLVILMLLSFSTMVLAGDPASEPQEGSRVYWRRAMRAGVLVKNLEENKALVVIDGRTDAREVYREDLALPYNDCDAKNEFCINQEVENTLVFGFCSQPERGIIQEIFRETTANSSDRDVYKIQFPDRVAYLDHMYLRKAQKEQEPSGLCKIINNQ